MPDIVGVAVQGRAIRGVEARIGRGGRCTVLRTGVVQLPDGTFDAGRLQDPAAMVASLVELWETAGFRSKRVRIGIDGRIAVVRRTELPSLKPDKLRQAARYDIAELLNFPISEAVFDVDEIEHFERNGITWARALVVAVQEAALDELASVAKDAGLRLAGTDLVAEALARSVQVESPGDPVAIVDCEDSHTNIVVRDDSGVLFARTLNVGVGETSISIADELESALAQLSGESQGSTHNVSAAAAGVATIVEGVRRTLGYYTTELDSRPIAETVVVGARGHFAGLLTSLEETLAMPARTASPTVQWPDEEVFLGFELPLGVALGATTSTARHLVLTSDHQRKQRRRRTDRLVSAAVSLPLAAVLAVSGADLRSQAADARNSADQVEAAAELLAARLGEFEPTRLRVSEWQTVATDIASIDAQRLRFGVVIEELAEAMPDDSRLVSAQLRRGGEEEAPTGYVGPAPVGLISITGIADDLDGVGRWIEQANRTSTIDGLWLDQSSFGPIGSEAEIGAIFTVAGAITPAAGALQSEADG